jgi:predicted esterase
LIGNNSNARFFCSGAEMKKNWIFLTLIFSNIVVTPHLKSMEREEQPQSDKTWLVVIPGQNGLGGDYAEELFPQFKNWTRYAGTQYNFPDLCQSRCVNHFAKIMKALQLADNVNNIVIHASSQGTGTAINYVSKYPDKVKMIFCEAMLPSGNSAISWTTQSCISSRITRLPGSYYWLPYIAKAQLPFYAPAGEQAIFNVATMKDIPIAIIHCTNDPQLSYTDAQAFYAGLKKHEVNNNKYFISIQSEERQHIDLISPQSSNALVLHKILHIHGLPFIDTMGKVDVSEIDIKPYQPAPERNLYRNLVTRERRIRNIDFSIKSGVVSLAGLYIASRIHDSL